MSFTFGYDFLALIFEETWLSNDPSSRAWAIASALDDAINSPSLTSVSLTIHVFSWYAEQSDGRQSAPAADSVSVVFLSLLIVASVVRFYWVRMCHPWRSANDRSKGRFPFFVLKFDALFLDHPFPREIRTHLLWAKLWMCYLDIVRFRSWKVPTPR